MSKEKTIVTIASDRRNARVPRGRPAPARGRRGLAAALVGVLALLFGATSAQAVTPATWRIDTAGLTNTTAEPGSNHRLSIQFSNIGDEPADGTGADPIVFSVELPPGMSVAGTEVENAFGAGHSEGITVPMGFYGVFDSSSAFLGWNCSGDGPGPSPSVEGAQEITCTVPQTLPTHEFKLENGVPLRPTIWVHVPSAAAGTQLASHISISGAGAVPASGAVLTEVQPQHSFGIAAFDMGVLDSTQKAYTRAAGHPFATTTHVYIHTRQNTRLWAGTPDATNPFEKFNGGPSSQDGSPVEPFRDVLVNLPPGLVGNASALPRCPLEQLVAGGVFQTPECAPGTQVGTVVVTVNPHTFGTSMFGPLAVHNVTPAAGSPATFAFNVYGTVVTLRARVRAESDYGISILVPGISQGLDFNGNSLTMWGQPGSPVHELERACPSTTRPEYVLFHGPTCEAEAAGKVPFLRMPTSCTAPGEGLPWSVAIDSWVHPGAFLFHDAPDLADPAWKTKSIVGHEAPGFSLPPDEWGQKKGVEDCGEVPFEPTFSVSPTTDTADSPSGLNVDITVPQDCWTEESAAAESSGPACQSDLRKAVVKLPQGMTINASSAGGLDACSPAQVGLTTPLGEAPVHFDAKPVTCPESSKIGNAEIHTPLLSEILKGGVYLAKQGDNPFRSTMALYLVVENPQRGIEIKLPGRVTLDESTGQLETVFDENPQQPFSRLRMELFGGPRAVLRTPPTCGTYVTTASLLSWSGNPPVDASSPFEITNCANGGFAPKLNAGTANPIAATYSPLSVRLTRDDGTQAIGGLDLRLPPGLTGRLAGIPYCPESTIAAIPTGISSLGMGATEIAAPHCPTASRIGTVTVGVGAGPTPFYNDSGRVYLAGTYRGAPISLVIVTPAVAGPFDLGNTVVRTALRIHPETVQINAVSDPLPTILAGVPLNIRDLRIHLDRSGVMLNPSSCDSMAIEATMSSPEGATATRSSRFQVAGCERLGFRPSLHLQLRGKSRGGNHPALRALVTYPTKGTYSNIASAGVTLPATELLENAHIKTICTRVQYASGPGGGVGCPPGSVYGRAKAWSPLLNAPLQGPVFLRSSSNELPDLVASLRGEIQVDLAGRIDTVGGRIRNIFDSVPDTPVSKFELEMAGGRKGLLVNTTNLCKAKPRATVAFRAHNNKVRSSTPLVKVTGCGKKGKKKKHRRHQG